MREEQEEERSAFQCASCRRDFEAEGHATVPIDWGTNPLRCPDCADGGEAGELAGRLREQARATGENIVLGNLLIEAASEAERAEQFDSVARETLRQYRETGEGHFLDNADADDLRDMVRLAANALQDDLEGGLRGGKNPQEWADFLASAIFKLTSEGERDGWVSNLPPDAATQLTRAVDTYCAAYDDPEDAKTGIARVLADQANDPPMPGVDGDYAALSQSEDGSEGRVTGAVCKCGHPPKWHADDPSPGAGACEYSADCACEHFVVAGRVVVELSEEAVGRIANAAAESFAAGFADGSSDRPLLTAYAPERDVIRRAIEAEASHE